MSDSQFCHLVDVLSQRALKQPEQTAYIFLGDGERETDRLTYQELDLKARAIASKLQSLDLANERVLLAYPSGLDFIAAFYGCLSAGVVAVPVNLPKRHRKKNRFETVAQDVAAKAILTTSFLADKLESWLDRDKAKALQRANLLFTDKIAMDRAKIWQKPDINLNSLAFIQYTSGSTNIPKGVMVSYGNLFHNHQAIAMCTENEPETVGVSWLPLHHDMGLIGHMLQALFIGRVNVLMPPETFLQQPFRWLKAISDYRGTISSSPNFGYELCLQKITPKQKTQLDLSSWRVANNGAEPVRAKTMTEFARYFASCGFRYEAFCPTYGMAETTLFVAGELPTKSPRVLQLDREALMQNKAVIAKENTKTVVSCGRSWQGSEIAIANPQTLARCQPEEIGEIWVNSPSVAMGYWQQPEKTKRIFQARLEDSAKTWLRSGDLGFLLDGELYVTGRLKDAIVIRGRNHYPLREEEPIHRSFMGSSIVTRYADVLRILRDSRFQSDNLPQRIAAKNKYLASQNQNLDALVQTTSSWLSYLEPPDHTRMRSLVSKAFAPKTVERLRSQIQQIVEHAIATAVEELLRYDSPIPGIARIPKEDIDLDGKYICAGQSVFLSLGAANRDPLHFKDPDKLDITRNPNPHLAFADGIHRCLGAALARMEGQIAIASLVQQFPSLQLQPGHTLEWRKNINLRGLKALPVIF